MLLSSVAARAFVIAVSAALLVGCSGDTESKVLGSSKTPHDGDGQPADDDGAAPEAKDFTVEFGFTTGTDSINTRYTVAGARITNPNDALASYDVQVLFNLLGEGGNVLDTQTETVTYVAPGESVPVAPLLIGFDQKQEPQDLEVQVVGEFTEDEGPRGMFGGDAAILEVKDAELQQNEFGTDLSAQVTNPTESVAEFASWACIFLDGDKILGGASSSIIDPIPPGSTVALGEPLSLKLEAEQVECRVVTDL